MKKVFAALGTVIAFLGLTSLIIFFAETTTNRNYELPHGSLVADISANDPVDQLADVSADTDVDTSTALDTSTDAGIVLASSTDFTVEADTSSEVTAVTSSDDQAADLDTDADTDVDNTSTDTNLALATSTPSSTTPPSTPSDTTDTDADANGTSSDALSQIPTPTTTLPDTTFAVTTATIVITPTTPTPPPTPPPTSSQPSSATPPVSFNESDFRGDGNWQTTWGTMEPTWSGAMDLSAGPHSTGGAVYLNSSNGWANYTFDAMLDWTGGRMFGLVANYQDSSNYVLCEYINAKPGTITMQLEQYVAGNEIFLSPATSIAWTGSETDIDASIKVSGVYGTCSFNGQSVSNDAIGPGMIAMSSAGSGEVGFEVNDPTPNTSEIIVSRVGVVSD